MAEEKNFENKIKKYLEEKNCWYVKYFANRNTKKGIPDILACVNGFFIAIEVKALKGKPSELQKYHQRRIREIGGISIIVYPNQYVLFQNVILALLEGNFTYAFMQQYEFDK